ncbi:MAG: glycosyl hydrolase family 18 protein [Acidobacteriota bacterium]|mgnify:CR=1 FL=1
MPLRYLATLLLLSVTASAEPKAIFYLTPTAGSIRSFLAHAARIDTVIPTFYAADAKGNVTGGPDQRVLDAARKHGVTLMPIVANPGFRQEAVHALLSDAAARARVSKKLLEECRTHQYRGIQLDFEQVPAADRDALTALVRETAALFTPAGLRVSVAVMYRTGDAPSEPGYSRWLHDNWLGAYDLAALAKHAEFLSVMTYDQHTERTPPGPVAGLPWVAEVADYCLRSVPREKLSLGIPLYGRRWRAGVLGNEAVVLAGTMSSVEALGLAAQMKVEPQWDAEERAPWFYFYRDGVREYVFYNDARSFRERHDLARRRQLHSFSAWVLGQEDPEIWKDLPEAVRTK